MRHATSFLPLLLALGCAPEHAEITGTYWAWLAAGSSATVDEEDLDLSGAVQFNCSGIEVKGFDDFDTSACSNPDDPDWFDPQFFTWLDDDGYYMLEGTLDTWRSEAIITSEGDIQLTFHVDLGDGQDFRLAWVIDPDFQPTQCTQDDDGNTSEELWDGEDWVDMWSNDEPGTIFYLNSGSYQLNPYDSEDFWVLPQDWLSGYAHAKFAAEEFNAHPSDFGMYEAGVTEGWYVELDPDDPDEATYQALLESVQTDVVDFTKELAGGEGTPAEAIGYDAPGFTMKVEDNWWRPVDQSSAGLDSWVQVDSSWVMFDQDPNDLVAGDSASGTFQILFDGAESGSRVLVSGTFDIPEVFEDRWGYTDLMDEKLEENNTPTCE